MDHTADGSNLSFLLKKAEVATSDIMNVVLTHGSLTDREEIAERLSMIESGLREASLNLFGMHFVKHVLTILFLFFNFMPRRR